MTDLRCIEVIYSYESPGLRVTGFRRDCGCDSVTPGKSGRGTPESEPAAEEDSVSSECARSRGPGWELFPDEPQSPRTGAAHPSPRGGARRGRGTEDPPRRVPPVDTHGEGLSVAGRLTVSAIPCPLGDLPVRTPSIGYATRSAVGGVTPGTLRRPARSAQREDMHTMDTRTPSAVGVGFMAAAGYPVSLFPARRAPNPTTPMPATAQNLVPAEEVQALLRRVESLLINELRGDGEARASCRSDQTDPRRRARRWRFR